MKRGRLVFLVAMALLTGGAAEQPKYQANPSSLREAIARGEVNEVLAALEAQALEAEGKGEWREAANAYWLASGAAMRGGQLQRAISYGNKTLELAEKAKALGLQARAAVHLVSAYRAVRQYAKAREWIDKGIEIVKKMPPSMQRHGIEANLYRLSGLDFLRQRQPQKAVEYISYSLEAQEARLSALRRQSKHNAESILTAENIRIATLYSLGVAHQRAGNTEEALKAYERGLAAVKETGLRTAVEASLYSGLGELYLNQKDYPRALENLSRTLEMAEKERLESSIYFASSRIANVYLQNQKPAEAIPYYKKAIDSIESTRSLLESEDLRSSYFEDKRATYGGMILAHVRTKNAAEAFNYSERARSRAFLDILGSKVQLAKGGTILEHERALQARISVLQFESTAKMTLEF